MSKVNKTFDTGACITCGRTSNIVMVAHRDEDGNVVGWVFVCTKCQNKVFNKDLVITINEKGEHNE